MDQSSFAAPQGLSQRTTSFIASQRQGIHQMLLRHLITLMINVRSAEPNMTKKERPVFRISPKDFFLLAKHIRRTRLRAVAGSSGLGCPTCRICCLFTISNIRASHTQEGRREPQDKIHDHEASWAMDIRNEQKEWWSLSGSNRRPEACKATALPAELRPHVP